MGLFMAARATNRMGARQQYRTMARMHRRRTYMASSMGMGQDFSSNEPEQSPTTEPDYSNELENLASLKKQGLINQEEYEAKKKQILGI